MSLTSIDDVRAAGEVVNDLAGRTPLLPATWAGQLWLKPECLQPTGAFKIRGAANAASRLPRGTAGVATHSSGNHGRALAYVARKRNLGCVVVAPELAAPVKLDAMRAEGAEVLLVPAADREDAAAQAARERGFAVIPPYDHLDVIAGQGTVATEILDDLADVDTVLTPIGGGGLASGVAVAVKALTPRTRVIGVEPAFAADAAESLHKGRLIHWSPERTYRTVADGTRACLSELTFAHLRTHLDDVVTVTEEQIRQTVGELAIGSKIVVEPSGALATAAYLHRRHPDWGRTVAIVSGGNVDPQLLGEVLGKPTPPK